MSIVSRILLEKPDSFYSFGGVAPFVDLSRRRTANLSPTITNIPVSPARGIKDAIRTTSAPIITLHKAPYAEFTLMVGSKVLTGSPTNLLSFYGLLTEGLWQTGNTINFGVSHVGGATTVVSAQIDSSRAHLITGVASLTTLSLYVDSALVGTQEITNPAKFGNDNTVNFSSTQPTMDYLAAVWMRALSSDAIAAINKAAVMPDTRTLTLAMFKASDLRLDNTATDTESSYFDENTNYVSSNAIALGTKISASYNPSLVSIAGSISFVAPFFGTDTGIRISWGDAVGAIVEYSLNGTTFFPVYNGQTVSAGTMLIEPPVIRVSFPAGQTQEMSIDNIEIQRQITAFALPELSNGRPVELTGSVSLPNDYNFNSYASLPATFGANGKVSILPETEDPTIMTYAVEFWYTPDATDLVGTDYILDSSPDNASTITLVSGKINFTGFSTVYVNKVATATNIFSVSTGVPVHVVAVYTTPNNAKITFGRATAAGQGRLSAVGLLFQTITSTDVNLIFDGQQDYIQTRYTDVSTIIATDNGPNTYTLVWGSGA